MWCHVSTLESDKGPLVAHLITVVGCTEHCDAVAIMSNFISFVLHLQAHHSGQTHSCVVLPHQLDAVHDIAVGATHQKWDPITGQASKVRLMRHSAVYLLAALDVYDMCTARALV